MTSSATPILKADALTVTLPPADAPTLLFRDFTLEIAPGRITCLLGAPGTGKTTLLKVLSAAMRTDPPGRVLYRGTPLEQPSPDILLVSPDEGLDPDLSARDNVAAGAGARIADTATRDALVDDLLDWLGLSDSAHLLPYQLSRGMRQRAAVARALAASPDALLLDEPFSALDVRNRGLMRQLLRDFQEDVGTTMIVVTHHVEDAILLVGRIVVLDGQPAGIAMDVDTGAEAFGDPDSPAFVELRDALERAIS